MNLIAAKVSDHVAHVSGHDIELGARYPKIKNGDAVIGFRPDFASLAPEGGIPVQVRRIEDLGRRRLARVALGPHEIFANVPEGVSIGGGKAGLSIQQDRLFVYVDDELVLGDRR
jgi:glycerol transport system ATP-binding protein